MRQMNGNDWSISAIPEKQYSYLEFQADADLLVSCWRPRTIFKQQI